MPITKGIATLVEQARQKITTLSLQQAADLLDDEQVIFVDIRDVRELQRTGTIPNAIHAPRGMLEFWVDPDSPYFKSVFAEQKTFVLFCQSAWRSSLAVATLVEMGMDNVVHFEGGFKAWSEADLPIQALS